MNNYNFYQSDVRPKGELFIGSSDIPVIIKPKNSKIKKTQFELWQEKTGKIDGFQGNEFTQWGHDLEPLLISAFIRFKYDAKTAYRFKVDYVLHEEWRDVSNYKPATEFHPFTECRNSQFPWALAHADCLYTGINPYNIEAKTGRYFSRIRREGLDGFDLEDNSANGIPIDVMLQVQWQMLCYDVNKTYVILLIDDNRFHIYEVEAIRKWWPMLLEKASRFLWHCKNDKAPQPENYDDVQGLFPEVYDKAVYLVGEKASIAQQMREEKKQLQIKVKKLESRIKDINDAAGLLMQENKYLYDGETGEKLFQQVIIKDQYNMIHPSTIEKQSPEVFKLLDEEGLINKSDRRYIK